MSTLGEFIKELRGKESLRDASKRIGISHTYLDTIEKGFDKRSGKHVNPTPETLKLISKAYNCNYKELMQLAGYLETENTLNKITTLTAKDERDIGKRIEELRYDLRNIDELTFNGEPMSNSTKEALLEAMEFSVRLITKNMEQNVQEKNNKKE